MANRVARGARSRPAAAIVSQGIVAGSSIVLQLVVSRHLGDAELGQFSLLLGTLITLNALQSGWIGDSLTVLDRTDPPIRAALQQAQIGALAVVALVALAVSALVEDLQRHTGLLFAGVMVLWAIEETGRRLLIARRDFWGLAGNDLAYAVGAFTVLVGAAIGGVATSIDLVLVAMGGGALTAIATACVQLPRDELRPVRRVRPATRELTAFAFWRSLQVSLRPGALAVTRFAVAASASTAVLGQLEAARIVMAPVLTLMGGLGVYLLPTYTHAIKAGRAPRPPIVTMMLLLVVTPFAFAGLVLVAKGPLVELLTDGKYAVTTTAIVCWAAYAAAFGAGIPPAHAVTATERSRLAFSIRALDNGVGVALAMVIAAAGFVSWVPLGLAVGGAVGALVLLRCARVPLPDRSEPVPA